MQVLVHVVSASHGHSYMYFGSCVCMKTRCTALALFYPDDDDFLSIRASSLVSIGLLLCDGVCIAACVALNRASTPGYLNLTAPHATSYMLCNSRVGFRFLPLTLTRSGLSSCLPVLRSTFSNEAIESIPKCAYEMVNDVPDTMRAAIPLLSVTYINNNINETIIIKQINAKGIHAMD